MVTRSLSEQRTTLEAPKTQQEHKTRRMGAEGLVAAVIGAGVAGLLMKKLFSGDSENKNGHVLAAEVDKSKEIFEDAVLTAAPHVPPPITRKYPVTLRLTMDSRVTVAQLTSRYKYTFWTFNDICPGPFIRARVGDTLELTHVNLDPTGMAHNIDFHAVSGPGGGAPLTFVEKEQQRKSRFKLLNPGLYVYHCAAAPLPMHVANGMYGLILVEPEEGLPPVDKEYYVMQSEFYFDPPESGNTLIEEGSYGQGMKEEPEAVVFNGREGSLTGKDMLQAKIGERVRIFFGNGGPNLTSAFHVIGTIFDKVYREGDLTSPPGRNIQTTVVPPGGSTVVEFIPAVPGNYTLVDHAIFRVDKGCVGFLAATGPPQPDIYDATTPPNNCVGCKLHQ